MSKIHDAVIFAGGKSSRMGEDKSLLPFGKYATLAEYQQVKLSKIFDNVYISAKEEKFTFECKVIKDTLKETSPLVALISIFETLPIDEVFILSVDAPFVDETTIEILFNHNENRFDAVIAQSPKGVQPLCGIYKRSVLPFAYAQLEKNNHRLTDLLALVKTDLVHFDKEMPFTNLNHPHEYQASLQHFENTSI